MQILPQRKNWRHGKAKNQSFSIFEPVLINFAVKYDGMMPFLFSTFMVKTDIVHVLFNFDNWTLLKNIVFVLEKRLRTEK